MAVLQTKEQTARSPSLPQAVSPASGGAIAHQRSRRLQIVSTTLLGLGVWGAVMAAPSRSAALSQHQPQILAATVVPGVDDPAGNLAANYGQPEPEIQLVQTKSPGPSSQAREPSDPEAPSVVWLIVMPAIPILGAAFIYISRRWLGRQAVETRSLPQCSAEEPTSCQPMAPQPKDLETDSLRD